MRFLSFAIAKATRQDASNPKVSSETNPDIGRGPAARNWAQLVCKDTWPSCTCVEWSVASLQSWWLSFIESLRRTLEKKTRKQ